MADDVGERLAAELKRTGWRFAAAESVTAGLVTSRAAQAPEASDWLLGGGVAELLRAEVGVATTGVGGPAAEEDQPAGTVWVGVYVDGRLSTHRLGISGDPAEVCQGAVERALDLVVDALRR